MKKIASALLVGLLCMAAPGSVRAGSPMGCQNSDDGGPKVSGLSLVCDVSVTSDDGGHIARETRGLITAITIGGSLRISAGKTLLDAFRDGDRDLSFQESPIDVILHWHDGNRVQASFTIAPVVSLTGSGMCGNMAVSAVRLNVLGAHSNAIPGAILRPMIGYLNNNARLQEIMRQRMNQLVQRLKHKMPCL